jgi:RNA polymerase sigma factor (sigma-70 family)
VRWTIRIALVFAGVYRLQHLQDDLISDALYALHGALRTYDPTTRVPLRSFLRIRIAGELCDAVTDARRRAAMEVALEDSSEVLPESVLGDPLALAQVAGVDGFVLGCAVAELHTNAETQYLRHEVAAGLRREMEQLAPEVRRQLDLRYWEHLTWDEIAAALGIPARTARDRDKKAREALRAALLTREAKRPVSRPRPRKG